MSPLNWKGQEFDVFKLLIAAVFMAAVLGVIMQVVGQYRDVNAPFTIDSIKTALKSVVDSKGTQTVQRTGLSFPEGFGLTSELFENELNLGTGNVRIKCPNSSQFEQGSSEKSCRAKRIATADVTVCKCSAPSVSPQRYRVLIGGNSSQCAVPY